MAYGIRLHVWGQHALFTRPELKVERVSYDVMTPSAARGVLEAIHWKPAIRWVIDRGGAQGACGHDQKRDEAGRSGWPAVAGG